jgi:starch-binding outer membrane protein, SusD/RagB family
MKNIKKFIIILTVIPILASCSKDFLDVKQKGVLAEDGFYTSMDSVKLAVNGTYANLNCMSAGLNTMDVQYLVYGSIASDDAEAGGEGGGNDFLDIQYADRGTVTPGDPKALSDYCWAYNYKTVLRANATLQGIRGFRSSGMSDADKALLNQYEGEMIFLRAFTFFKLVQIYGGVPIIDHILTPSEYLRGRDSISTCLHFIEKELRIASILLPLRSQFPIEELGRATKGAAQALLAKAYLYEASYAKNYPSDKRFTGCANTYNLALVYADSVIASNEYELVGIDGATYDTYWSQNNSPLYKNGTPGYRYIFTPDGKNSKEAVWETQAINDGQDYMLTRGSYITIYTGVRNYNKTTYGWGFNCPSDSLLNAYEPGDPRIIVSIGKTGDSIYAGVVTARWGRMDCKQSPTNMIGRKFEASPKQYWKSKKADGNGPNNFPYIRYADVLLMAAEASLETGQPLTLSGLTPLQIVNNIRKRARNGAALGAPADLTSVSFQDIVKERRLEMAMEGSRFFDLVRWRMQSKLVGIPLLVYLNNVVRVPSANTSCTFTPGKNDFMPIPLQEIINSQQKLEQYDGW